MTLEDFPFQFSEDLPNDIPSIDNPVPLTIVNTRPLDGTPFIAPFVPCPIDLVPICCDILNITTNDVLMDLGCGDGRILVKACEVVHPPPSVIGIELDPYLADHARRNLKGVVGESLVLEVDMFRVDLEEFDVSVMILYLLPAGLDKLRAKIERWLDGKSERRLITIDYAIPWRIADFVHKTAGKKNLNVYRSVWL